MWVKFVDTIEDKREWRKNSHISVVDWNGYKSSLLSKKYYPEKDKKK